MDFSRLIRTCGRTEMITSRLQKQSCLLKLQMTTPNVECHSFMKEWHSTINTVVPQTFPNGSSIAKSRFSQGSQCQILRSALCEIAVANKTYFLGRDR